MAFIHAKNFSDDISYVTTKILNVMDAINSMKDSYN